MVEVAALAPEAAEVVDGMAAAVQTVDPAAAQVVDAARVQGAQDERVHNPAQS